MMGDVSPKTWLIDKHSWAWLTNWKCCYWNCSSWLLWELLFWTSLAQQTFWRVRRWRNSITTEKTEVICIRTWNNSGSWSSSGCSFSGAMSLYCNTDQSVNPVRARRWLYVPPAIHSVPLQSEHTVFVFFFTILSDELVFLMKTAYSVK